MAFRPLRSGWRALTGHRNARNIEAVQATPMDTTAGTAAIQGQLQMGAEQAQRQAAGMGAARGSTALNRFQAQNVGSQAMTQANQQAGVLTQQLQQAAAQQQSGQQFDANMAQQGYQEAVRNRNTQGLAGMAQGILGAGGAMLMSDIRAKEDIRPIGGTPALREALGGYAPAETQPGPTSELAAAMGQYAPQQSVPERAQELDRAVSMGLLSYEDLDADDRTLLNRYTATKLDRWQADQMPQGDPNAGAIARAQQQAPSPYEQGYREMQGRLTGPMRPYEYRYRPEAAAAMGEDTRPRVGVMAQDAARSPLYGPAVTQAPDGSLGFDRDRALQATMAGVADLDRRQTAEETEPTALQRLGYGLRQNFGGYR